MTEASLGKSQEDLTRALGYAIEDVDHLLESAEELAVADPNTAEPIVRGAIAFLGGAVGRATELLGRLVPEGRQFEVQLASPVVEAVRAPNKFHLSSFGEPDHYIGALAEDKAALDRLGAIESLKQELENDRGIYTEQDLERVTQTLFDLTSEQFADALSDKIIALPDGELFDPYRFVMDGAYVVAATGHRYSPTRDSLPMYLFNFMAVATFFGGIRSSLIKEYLGGRPLATVGGSIGYTAECRSAEIFLLKPPRGDGTYAFQPWWIRGGFIDDSTK